MDCERHRRDQASGYIRGSNILNELHMGIGDPPVRKTLRIVNLLFATAIVKHYGGHFETTFLKGD